MKTYIGVKMVQAEPEAKDGIQGYKVVYSEPDKPDYVSWCPKDIFERHNRETQAMPFSKALEAVKLGKKIARKSWNGKGLWVRLICETREPLTSFFLVVEYPKGHSAYPAGSCIPWQPSQTDMLSDDWFIVE